MNKKILITIFFVFLFVPIFTFGQANRPFGGKITNVDYSTCNCRYFSTTKITISPPLSSLPRTVLYHSVLSRLYPFNQLQTNRYVLGWYNGYAACMKQVYWWCTSVGSYPLIVGVGTSGGSASGVGGGDDLDSSNPPPQSTSTPPSVFCNKDTMAGWNFNPGIQNQIGDASPSLKNLLYCMCNRLKPKGITGLITSISDSNHIGKLQECRQSNIYQQCSIGTVNNNCCWHSNTSCHYGGNNINNKSYAVDLGMGNSSEIKQVARQCAAGDVRDEGNHIHVATLDCRSGD